MPKYACACPRCAYYTLPPDGQPSLCPSCKESYWGAVSPTVSVQMIKIPITQDEVKAAMPKVPSGGKTREELAQQRAEVDRKIYETYIKDWDTLDKDCMHYKLHMENYYFGGKGPINTAIDEAVKRSVSAQKAEAQLAALHPTYTCPTCGSTNVEKLTVAKRGISVWLFGAASNTINKSFKCKSCGYTW